jgi:hypothetical protein
MITEKKRLEGSESRGLVGLEVARKVARLALGQEVHFGNFKRRLLFVFVSIPYLNRYIWKVTRSTNEGLPGPKTKKLPGVNMD